MAQFFYLFGTTHYSRGQKQPVLVENEMWRLPDEFPIFKDLFFDFFLNGDQGNEILEVYKRYKA